VEWVNAALQFLSALESGAMRHSDWPSRRKLRGISFKKQTAKTESRKTMILILARKKVLFLSVSKCIGSD